MDTQEIRSVKTEQGWIAQRADLKVLGRFQGRWVWQNKNPFYLDSKYAVKALLKSLKLK